MRTLDKSTRAGIIIHSFAVAAATWSATTAWIPVAGPALGDTFGLTAITIAMTYSLANLFGKKLEEAGMWSFSSVVLGTVFGISILKSFASIIPMFGSGVNATITFGLHEAIGWGLYLVFESGGDPTKISREELQAYIQQGKEMAKKEKCNYDKLMNNLPEEVRAEVEALQKKLADHNLSDTERSNVAAQIVAIFNRYKP